MYHICVILLHVILRLFSSIKVIDKKNLPKSGAYVLACTHNGWVDILWLGLVVWPRPVHYMAKEELFRNKFIGWFLGKIHAFPVNRDNPGPSSLKIPFNLLKQGNIVGIFPGGTRTSEEISLKRGAVTIATRSSAPLVPAAYVGPTSLKFRNLFRRKSAIIAFGEPITTLISKNKDEAEKQRGEITEKLNNSFNLLKEKCNQHNVR